MAYIHAGKLLDCFSLERSSLLNVFLFIFLFWLWVEKVGENPVGACMCEHSTVSEPNSNRHRGQQTHAPSALLVSQQLWSLRLYRRVDWVCMDVNSWTNKPKGCVEIGPRCKEK
jgi:hypothetical protein